MKENAVPVAIKVCYVLSAISALGLVLAVLGILCQQDPLYYTGLFMAAPLFLVMLPICFSMILSMVLAPVVIIRELVKWWRKATVKDHKTDDQPPC